MSLEITLFRPEDGAACEAISADVFGGLNIPFFLEAKYGIPGHGAAMNAYWARVLYQSRPDRFLVVREAGQVVGFAGLTDVPAWGLGWVVHLGVARTAQGRGVGRRMVAAGLDLLRGLGLSVAWIEYDRGNERAGGLYRRLGFRDFGRVLYFAAPASTSPEAAATALEEPDPAALPAVAGEAPLFPEEVVVGLHGLAVSQPQAREHCLRERLSHARAYALASGSGRAFALAGPEGDGRALHLPAFWAGDAGEGAALLRAVVARFASHHHAAAAYVEVYEPEPATLAALAAAGFTEIHGLGCLSRPL